MPKLKPETVEARREHILDASERCFARSGFHRTTMADICAEAKVSAGALYVHFESKEALIAGIVERDRTNLTDQFAEMAKAPDLTAAIGALGEHYTFEQPQYKRILNLEIAAEATRNENIAEIWMACDRFVIENLTNLIADAQRDGRVNPVASPEETARMICVIGEGMFWRRAVDTELDGESLMPIIMHAIASLLRPTGTDDQTDFTAGPPQRVAELEQQS
ncbi:MAG: TetR/AcrR family transcriptional regulator [Filomicrobium sp.]